MSTGVYPTEGVTRTRAVRLADLLELAKPEVTLLVVVSALAGFYLATRGPLDWLLLFHTLVGTMLVSGGTAAFNQYFEREDDARMRRTARRPIPAGRLDPRVGLAFASFLSVGGVAYLLYWVNVPAGFLAFLTWASYLLLYTPLKKRTVWCTAVGAFPGAAPPLIGWVAAGGSLTLEAWTLYAILFLWQFPHFLAIAWMYREDYARAGILMLPVVDPAGKATGRQVVGYSSALLPVALVPTALGMAGNIYFWGALLLGAAFLVYGVKLSAQPSNLQAKRLLHASVLYLPLLFALLMLDKQ